MSFAPPLAVRTPFGPHSDDCELFLNSLFETERSAWVDTMPPAMEAWPSAETELSLKLPFTMLTDPASDSPNITVLFEPVSMPPFAVRSPFELTDTTGLSALPLPENIITPSPGLRSSFFRVVGSVTISSDPANAAAPTNRCSRSEVASVFWLFIFSPFVEELSVKFAGGARPECASSLFYQI